MRDDRMNDGEDFQMQADYKSLRRHCDISSFVGQAGTFRRR
jgi:hypothetical protein